MALIAIELPNDDESVDALRVIARHLEAVNSATTEAEDKIEEREEALREAAREIRSIKDQLDSITTSIRDYVDELEELESNLQSILYTVEVYT